MVEGDVPSCVPRFGKPTGLRLLPVQNSIHNKLQNCINCMMDLLDGELGDCTVFGFLVISLISPLLSCPAV